MNFHRAFYIVFSAFLDGANGKHTDRKLYVKKGEEAC